MVLSVKVRSPHRHSYSACNNFQKVASVARRHARSLWAAMSPSTSIMSIRRALNCAIGSSQEQRASQDKEINWTHDALDPLTRVIATQLGTQQSVAVQHGRRQHNIAGCRAVFFGPLFVRFRPIRLRSSLTGKKFIYLSHPLVTNSGAPNPISQQLSAQMRPTTRSNWRKHGRDGIVRRTRS